MEEKREEKGKHISGLPSQRSESGRVVEEESERET